jgi:hypothetical protein
MNDQKKTKAQLIEELDGLLGEAVVERPWSGRACQRSL